MTAIQAVRGMSMRREGGAVATIDAGTTTSAGEGRTPHFGQVVGGMTLQLDQHDCGFGLRAFGFDRRGLDQRQCGAGTLQRAVLLNGGLQNDLCEGRRNGLEHQAVHDARGQQADQAVVIAAAADRDHDERGFGLAQPLGHAPQRRKLIGDQDAAAVVGCELDGFFGSARRGDRVVCGGGVVNRVSERGIVGQNCDRNARGRVDPLLDPLRAPAYSRDCSELAGVLDVVQVAYAHCATLVALRPR